MKIKEVKGTLGSNLYGTLVCEHCGAVERFDDGHHDLEWLREDIPSKHCSSCGMNRVGEKA